MNVSGVNSNNTHAINNAQSSKVSAENAQDTATQNAELPDEEPAFIIDVSEEGRRYAIGEQVAGFNPSEQIALEFDRSLFTEPGPLVGHVRKQTLDMIHHRLPDVRGLISIDFLISDALEGEKINSPTATEAGKELASMIMANAYGNGSTVEERAMNRELGMKHAEHIAANYFEDKDEAKAFLDRMRLEYENDILREKGYEGVGMNNELSPQQSGAESNRKFIRNG